MKKSSENNQILIAKSLTQLDNPAVRGPFLKMILDESLPFNARYYMLNYLSKIADTEIITNFIELLEKDYGEIKNSVTVNCLAMPWVEKNNLLKHMRTFADERIPGVIIRIIEQDLHPEVTATAINALGAFKEKKTIQVLGDLLNSEHASTSKSPQ